MATTADLMTLQQQIRQERWQTPCSESVRRCTRQSVADWMQSTAFPVPCRGSQQVQQKQPSRTESMKPKSWDGSHEKGMQAWSDQGERILVRVESVDKVDRSTLAVDCVEADFITLETTLCQVLHRTTTNEPLRMAGSTSTRSERICSLASDRQEKRSEKHARPKLGVCSAD